MRGPETHLRAEGEEMTEANPQQRFVRVDLYPNLVDRSGHPFQHRHLQ